MTKEQYQEKHDELMETLRDACNELLISEDSTGCSEDLAVVSSDSISKIKQTIEALGWLENTSVERGPKAMKKFTITARATQQYKMVVEAESEEQALDLGDHLLGSQWDGHAHGSLYFEVQDAIETGEED